MKRISFTLLFTLLFMQVVAAHDEASTLLANASENATELATPDKDDKGTGVDQENKKTPIFTKPKFSGFAIASYQATFQESGNSNSFNVRTYQFVPSHGRILCSGSDTESGCTNKVGSQGHSVRHGRSR